MATHWCPWYESMDTPPDISISAPLKYIREQFITHTPFLYTTRKGLQKPGLHDHGNTREHCPCSCPPHCGEPATEGLDSLKWLSKLPRAWWRSCVKLLWCPLDSPMRIPRPVPSTTIPHSIPQHHLPSPSSPDPPFFPYGFIDVWRLCKIQSVKL